MYMYKMCPMPLLPPVLAVTANCMCVLWNVYETEE